MYFVCFVVRSYLRLNTPDIFVCEGRGLYGLRDLNGHAQRVFSEMEERAEPFAFGKSVLFHANCFDWMEQREKLRSFFHQWTRLLLPKLVPGANVLVASNPLLSPIVAGAMTDAGLERRGEIIRLVMTMRGGDRPKHAHEEFSDVSVMPRSMWEPWLVFRKPPEGRIQDNLRKWKTGGFRRPSAERPFGDVIESAPTRTSERALAPHPSLKPQAFLRQIVRAALPLSDGVILDPFAGAGSTLAAAEAVGYASIGIEKDASYFSVARKAIPKLAALRIASGDQVR